MVLGKEREKDAGTEKFALSSSARHRFVEANNKRFAARARAAKIAFAYIYLYRSTIKRIHTNTHTPFLSLLYTLLRFSS